MEGRGLDEGPLVTYPVEKKPYSSWNFGDIYLIILQAWDWSP
jgi:hypothetical protein